jgi:hypothetical protein
MRVGICYNRVHRGVTASSKCVSLVCMMGGIMIDPKSHSENRGWIEGFLRMIPGFRGYLEKDYRQESDRMTRIWMADRLARSRRSLDELMAALANRGKIEELATYEQLKNRIDALCNKMRAAVRGYSGFFDYVRVDENLLERVYQHDMALVQDVERLAAEIERQVVKPDEGSMASHEMLSQIGDLDRRFDQRADLLNGVGR